ncbi:MAG: hypothetical protein H0X39_16385 [Actinobacteria bacterium]|nr:hypothetical protein [Actinomycetota bacterium]
MLKNFDVGSVRIHDVAFTTRSLTDYKGLTGVPPSRGNAISRPEQDGGVETPLGDQYVDPRIVTLEGEVWGASIDAVWADWDVIVQAFEAFVRGPVLCSWSFGSGTSRVVQGYARLLGEIDGPGSGDNIASLIRWQAQLRFADPRWYSSTLQSQSVGTPTSSGGMALPVVFPIAFGSGSSGGTMTATNSGRTRTWPQLVVAGPITNPVVANITSGRALYFSSLTLAAGQTLIIETNPLGPRAATVGGVSVIGSIDASRSAWWGLEVGANSLQFYGDGGYAAGTTLTESHRDAWLS